MVEFALVAPLFFMIVLGVIELGRGLMVTQLLTHAARVGCRKAVTGTYTTSQVQAEVANTLSSFGISGASVAISVDDSAGTVLNGSTPSGTEITVSVSIPVDKVTWVPGGSFLKADLSGQFTMRKE